MFTAKEIAHIDSSYFRIIHSSCFTITLQSKNTNHLWHIIHQVYPHFSSCQIHHSHNASTPYHLHGYAPTLKKALEKIKSHDMFQLNGRKKHYK